MLGVTVGQGNRVSVGTGVGRIISGVTVGSTGVFVGIGDTVGCGVVGITVT
jgi:hypothetical protein